MSNAIEVLKEWIKLLEEESKENTGNKDLDFKLNNGQEIKINILKEALLALEQKEKFDNLSFVCDSCGSETASCLTLCPDCNDRKQGALEVLQRIDYHKDWIDRNCKTILEKEEYAYKYLQELQKEYGEGVSSD